MKVTKGIKGTMASALAVTLVALAGCSGSGNGSSTASPSAGTPAASTAAATSSPAATEKAKEPITLKVQFNSTGTDVEGTDVYNEIAKRTGVTMKIETFDEEKFKVQLAGGDLPDIIQVKHVGKTYLQQLIEGKHIIPLDDLIKTNGPDIMKPSFAPSLNYSKKFWSNDTNKLYMVPVQTGTAGWGYDQQTGFAVRWDYYKELGYPQIKNIDDMVNVLDQMVKKHPTTPDGKKVYGTAIWNDWGTWGLKSMGLITGNGTFNYNTGKLVNTYIDPTQSEIWDTIYFLYKAQQKGILDPDAFTAKYSDIEAKGTQGTLLNSIATWPFKLANADLLKQGADKGFMTIPLDWGIAYTGGSTVAGWGDRGFAITKNAKDPQRAMDLINFLVSEEGSRLIQSGVKGVHWDVIDGKPQMKPETIKLAAAGGDVWKKSGINMLANQQGLTDNSKLSDGGIVNLFLTPDVYKTRLNSMEKDYADYYKATYPAEAYKKQVDAGKVKTLDVVPQDVMNAMPSAPEDIKRIQAKLEDIITKGAPEIVLKSKDDADYQARQKELIEKLKAEGADQYFQWYEKAFNETKAKLGN